MFRIYLTNLGKYNDGYLVGEWVNLPIDEDGLEAVKNRIGINEFYEEWFITDYENDYDYPVHEYENLSELNELAEQLESLNSNEKLIVQARCKNGERLNEAIDNINDAIVWNDVSCTRDLGERMADELGITKQLEDMHLDYYFDFEAYGRDIEIDGTFIYMDDGICVELFY